MSNDKVRAEFEAWAIREYWLAECALARKKSGVYRDSRAAFAWAAWQASRAALMVELPENGRPAVDNCAYWHNVRNSAIAACRRAIEAAGVGVKP